MNEGYEVDEVRYAISCYGDKDYQRLKNMLEFNRKKYPRIPRRSTSEERIEKAIAMSLGSPTHPPSISKTSSEDEDKLLERAIQMSLADKKDQIVSPLLRTSSSVSKNLDATYRKDCEDAAAQVGKINMMMQSVGTNFVDAAFRPNSSILLFGTESESKRRNIGPWLRPNEIRGVRAATRSEARLESTMPWTVFRGTVDSDDIQQGKLGDCWFLSALSCLAQRPDLVKRLVLTQTYNPRGVYLVRLMKDGLWHNVIVDDYMVCTTSGVLAFTSSKRKQLYVPIIEKAFAKLHGSFGALEGGTCAEGLQALTGCPVVSLKINSSNTDKTNDSGHFAKLDSSRMLWVRLLSSFEAGYLMAAACHPSQSNLQEAQKNGLQASHAYSILDVKGFKQHRLIKLRNPHGSNAKTYRGDFGVLSTKWTQELRNHFSEFRSGGSDSGVFWMDVEDFFKYFHVVHICEVPSRGNLNRFETRHSNSLRSIEDSTGNLSVFQLESKERATNVSCVLHQPREFRRGGVPNIIGMLIVKLMGSDLRTVKFVDCSEWAPGGSVLLQCDFDVGKYILIPIAIGNKAKNKRWVLAVHSAKRVCVTNFRCPRGLVSRAFVLMSKQRGNRVALHGEFSLYRYTSSSGAIFVALNESRTITSRVKLQANVHNAKMIKSEERNNVVISNGSFETNDAIGPRKCQVLAVVTPIKHDIPWRINIKFGMENSLMAFFRTFTSTSDVTSDLYDSFPIGSVVF